MELRKVFESIKVKNVEIPNRIAFPPINANYADKKGFVTQRVINFYENIAKGGAGLCIVGVGGIRKDGKVTTNMLMIDDDKYINELKGLFMAIKQQGSIPSIQLIHSGRQTCKAITGSQPVAPSSIPCPVMQETPKELSESEIRALVRLFGEAAERAKNAGAEMVEIHAAHGYLINEFLSPYSNKREDEYGGNTENRSRFLGEILKEVRNKVGVDYPICCRISAVEFVEGGVSLEESKKIAKIIEESGADLISVSAGVYESMDKICPKKEDGRRVYSEISRAIKDSVNIPIIAVGNILSLQDAEKVLLDGDADMVAMGRALIADPDLIPKTKQGRVDEINWCIQDRKCMYWTTGEPYMSCSVNKGFIRRRNQSFL